MAFIVFCSIMSPNNFLYASMLSLFCLLLAVPWSVCPQPAASSATESSVAMVLATHTAWIFESTTTRPVIVVETSPIALGSTHQHTSIVSTVGVPQPGDCIGVQCDTSSAHKQRILAMMLAILVPLGVLALAYVAYAIVVHFRTTYRPL